jgi:Zn finger protein HypA/HybF involved in hydrogenase expression
MHEMSIALAICQMAEDRLGADALRQVTQVGLTVGDASGVELSSLEFCLDTLLAAPPFAGAKSAITRSSDDALRLDYFEVDDAR